MTKVTVTGYEGNTSSDVVIQKLDSLGNAEATYLWHDYDKKDKKTGETIHYEGWYDQDNSVYIQDGEVIIPAGKGLWVSAPSSDWKLLCNGQVLTAGQAIQLRADFVMVANPYPIAVDLTALWVSGYEGNTSSDVVIQKLDNLGNAEATYLWHDYDKKDKKTGETIHYEGWYDQDNGVYIAQGDMLINPNDGLWVSAPADTWYLNFPGILGDAPKAE